MLNSIFTHDRSMSLVYSIFIYNWLNFYGINVCKYTVLSLDSLQRRHHKFRESHGGSLLENWGSDRTIHMSDEKGPLVV